MAAASFDECSTAELADAIGQLHALACAAQRQMLAAVAAYDSREAWREDGATSMAAWLAYRLGVSHRTGSEWGRTASALEDLPALADAFGEGRLSADQVVPLTKVATAETDEVLAAEAVGWTAARCSSFARRVRAVSDEESSDREHRRYVRWHWDLGRGLLSLHGRLAAESGATVVAALERIAEAAKPDPETGLFDPYEWRAADALVELASAHLGAAAQPDRATIVIHADASALTQGEGTAEIEGGVPVNFETLRRRACDGRVEWVMRGADGKPLGVGRARRTVPAWLARQLRRRDAGCRFPACERRRWGHAHHRRHWADGGATDLDNLIWLCPTHHRLVHEGGWSIRVDPAGEVTFVRPDGRALVMGPPALRRQPT